VNPEAEAAARDLFFAYEGSTFYMSRDGSDREFEAMDVPQELRRRWLEELTANRLAAIGEPGGWQSVNFFLHHGLVDHLQVVIGTAPAGKPWERTAYLELAAKYVDKWAAAKKDRSEARLATQQIEERARELLADYRMRGQRDRLNELIDLIRTRRNN
jgi:hypothetical protein